MMVVQGNLYSDTLKAKKVKKRKQFYAMLFPDRYSNYSLIRAWKLDCTY